MTTPTSTPARDRLAANHRKAGDLRGRVAQLWSDAEAGKDVDPAEVTAAEQELSVADRLTAVLQRAALAEQVAEQQAAWEEVETATLAEHKRLSAQFLDQLDAARAAMTAVASSAEKLHHHLAAFTGDPRRPPKLGPDGTPQQLLGGWERSTVHGQQMYAPGAVDVVLTVAAEEVDRLTNGRGDSLVVAQLHHVRASTKFPTDNRK
jgi:hypothetical protein